MPALGRVLEFMRIMWAVDHGLQRTSKRMSRVLGVTAPQRLVVRLLGRFPGLTTAELAGILQLDVSTVSVVVQKLEARRLARRGSDPRDGRRAPLSLTRRGRALDRQAQGTVEDAVRLALAQMPPRKVDHAREVLLAVASALQGAAPPAPTSVRRAAVRP
jgi:DNA-binding MarR family transcriptional regulator